MTETSPPAVAPAFTAVREKLTSWLLADGYSLREGPARDAAWLLIIEDPAKRRFMVGQKPGREDVVVLQGTITVGEEHAGRLDELPEQEREDFLYELRLRLLGLGLDFQGVAHPLRQVSLTEHLYCDGMTRKDFFQSLKRIRHGTVAVIWMVGRKLQQPAPPEEGRGIAVN